MEGVIGCGVEEYREMRSRLRKEKVEKSLLKGRSTDSLSQLTKLVLEKKRILEGLK